MSEENRNPELEEDELEAVNGELLPDREQMTVLNVPGEMPPPGVADPGPPVPPEEL